MLLFAQGKPPQDLPPEVLYAVLGAACFVILVGLAIQIFFLLTVSRCFSYIAPHNRQMEPGMVWLNLIPLFALVWIFFTVIRLADSLKDEYHERDLDGDEDFGRSIGIAYAALAAASAIPYCGAIFGIAALVCFILYWVKIAGYNKQLESGGAGGDYEDDA